MKAGAIDLAVPTLDLPAPRASQQLVIPMSPLFLTPVCLWLGLAPTSVARAQTPGTDNRDGRFVNLEEAPIHPMELSGGSLWVANIPDARVSVMDPGSLALQAEIPVGLGPVTVRRRPALAPSEIWVVCQSSNAVFIIDQQTRRTIDSIPLRSEPAGLLFSDDGTSAYVTLSATSQLVRIDTVSRTPAPPVEVQSSVSDATPLHAEEPRALFLDGNSLYVLPFESGNGTAAHGTVLNAVIVDLWHSFANGVLTKPPPDRDALRFDVTNLSLPAEVALWRMGTLNFDIKKRPVSAAHFYVSNVDHDNLVLGDFQFASPTGAVARHRVSHATPHVPPGAPPQLTTHIDLNAASNRGPGLEGVKFAVPTEMVFTDDGATLYVACYESRNTAVIEVANDRVVGALQADGHGPRGLLLDEQNDRLYVYNRADHTVDMFTVPTTTVVSSPATGQAIGFDPTPASVKAGRLHFIDAANSGNGVQSCNTCHMDGHLDRIAWDLTEFTGDTPDHPVQKRPKGTKVTKSLRGIEETPPYLWRGDLPDFEDFNVHFRTLLGGQELPAEELAELQSFAFSLSVPPNPNQALDREYTQVARAGRERFQGLDENGVPLPSDEPVSTPSGGTNSMACVDCHTTDENGAGPYFSNAGSGQHIVNCSDDSEVIFGDDVPELRGLFDKVSDVWTTDTVSGPGSAPVTGFGLASSGAMDTVADFVDLFALIPQSMRPDIVQYLLEFDSGLAPSTAWCFTLTQAKAQGSSTSGVVDYLIPEANKLNCDLVVRGWYLDASSTAVPIGMVFDRSSQKFQSDNSLLPMATYEALHGKVAIGRAVLSFIGVPVGMGRPLGIDRDLDFLGDADEGREGTQSTDQDSDDDGYPDGYEVLLGSDPNDGMVGPAMDESPLVIAADGVAWTGRHVAKIQWTTSRVARSTVTVTSTSPWHLPLTRTFVDDDLDRRHVMRIRGLRPGDEYQVSIQATDPLGRQTSKTLTVDTGGFWFPAVHVDEISIPNRIIGPAGQVVLMARARITEDRRMPMPNAVVSGRWIEWPSTGGAALITPFTVFPTDADGRITWSYTSSHALGSQAFVEVIIDAVDHAELIYFSPLDREFSARTNL